MPTASFSGLRVLSLETRHAKEISKLIVSFGGKPVVAPAMREVKLESDSQALSFAAGLMDGQFDLVIFLTGAGIRGLMAAIENVHARTELRAALGRAQVMARGPKPAAVLSEIGVKPNLVAPAPNTWREVLRALDDFGGSRKLKGLRIAVQEYGVPCTGLLTGLSERGARVTRVPVYRWSLPEDVVPLQEAATMISKGEIDVVLLTAAAQAEHLFQVAAAMGIEDLVRARMERIVIASVGPTTSEHLGSLGLRADMEATHPRMGYLVEESAARSAEILREKHKELGLDFLHEIGSRMSGSNSLRGVLRRIMDFAASLVKCDSCFVYVLEDNELVLRASKNPHPEEVDHLRLGLGEGITGWVAKNRQPVSVACNAFQDSRFQFFNELPEDRYEAFLSVPILCRGQVVGVINLQNRQPHSYTRREIRLLSTIGFFVGAEIEMARLEEKSSQLSEELEARKIVERAKGILQRELQVSEEEAYLTLRRQSRKMRKTMKEVAQAIIREKGGRIPKHSLA
ncbi:MAG: uroporphyrinogen-III synthase [Acidobacteriia bacterium]|nr:uroporphyrinogen-III synthase [Terriglobia bacterium]